MISRKVLEIVDNAWRFFTQTVLVLKYGTKFNVISEIINRKYKLFLII